MDYKEKYEQALERAVKLRDDLLKNGTLATAKGVESIFPELAESEDERIRKEMIETLKNEAHEFPSSIIAEKSKSWLSWLEKQSEQKPVKTPQWMIEFLDDHRRHFGSPMEHEERRDVNGKLLCIKKWLEGNCVEQKPAEWSEEDEEISSAIVKRLEGSCALSVDLQSAICWVENVKDRVQLQPKQEWSKDDELNRQDTIRLLVDAKERYLQTDASIPKCIKWLENLSPQPHWKPSDEQMKAIRSSAYCPNERMSQVLFELYQDLDKLRGE